MQFAFAIILKNAVCFRNHIKNAVCFRRLHFIRKFIINLFCL